jgi:hypothetical protein
VVFYLGYAYPRVREYILGIRENILQGYVKLKKKILLRIRAIFRVSHRRPGREDI